MLAAIDSGVDAVDAAMDAFSGNTAQPCLGSIVEALKARGHDVVVAEPNSVGRLTAALRHEDGMMQAAATPRLMQAYAIGR